MIMKQTENMWVSHVHLMHVSQVFYFSGVTGADEPTEFWPKFP